MCCVTIVKVSSIWFLQWFPFSYNVHYYFVKLFFFNFYLYLLVAWICVKHQLSYLQFALLPAFYNHYGWWTCSWSEDNLQLQSTWSKVWQGKLFNSVSTLSLSLSLVFLRMQRTCEFMLSEIPLLPKDSQICKCWPLWFLLILIIIFQQVEIQYLHDYAAVSSSVGLTVNPIVNFSGVIGTNVASLGTDLSFDTKTGDFIKCNAGVSLSKVDLIASLTLWVVPLCAN